MSSKFAEKLKGWAVFKLDTYFTPTNSYEENTSHICGRILGIQIWLNVCYLKHQTFEATKDVPKK